MNDHLETLLRSTLHDQLDQVQPSDELARVAAQRGSARRRRALVAISAAAAAVVGLSTAGMALLQSLNGDSLTASTDGLRTAPAPPAGQQAVSFHGIQLFVPSDWAVGASSCPGTGRPHVRFVDGASAGCAEAPAPVTSVLLADASGQAGTHYAALATSPAFVDGKPARRGRGPAPGGAPVADVLLVPQTGAVVVVFDLEQAGFPVLDSVHFAEVDQVGCRDQITTFVPPAPQRQDARTELLPGGPVRVGVCRYVDGWLMRSHELAGAEIRGLQQLLGAAPIDVQTTRAGRCSVAQAEGVLLRAEYATGEPVVLSARIDGCPWQVSNGTVTRGLTGALITALTDAVGHTNSLGNTGELPTQ